ncbi:MAG: hypothetical protein HYV68_02400 [Candidatus Taylorbacteria bacterium]|nr:hypothetical protein [Candidatus Taylorbacteria bacterium]
MMINVEVEKTGSETNASLLRRFSRRVQSSGIIIRVKGGRYKDRTESKYKRKVRTLSGLERRKKTERLIKLGKITPRN